MALAALPTIQQAFVHHPKLTGDELEAAIYRLRRSTQADWLELGGKRRTSTQRPPRPLPPLSPPPLPPAPAPGFRPLPEGHRGVCDPAPAREATRARG